MFCKSTLNLTKEHVFPKWLFEKDTKIRFISSVNRQSQTYNKAVIPTCSDCNNDTLAEKRAKEKAFSKGRPIIFGEGGKVFTEWPDGRIEELKAEG